MMGEMVERDRAIQEAIDFVMEKFIDARMLDTGDIDAHRAKAAARRIAEAVAYRAIAALALNPDRSL